MENIVTDSIYSCRTKSFEEWHLHPSSEPLITLLMQITPLFNVSAIRIAPTIVLLYCSFVSKGGESSTLLLRMVLSSTIPAAANSLLMDKGNKYLFI